MGRASYGMTIAFEMVIPGLVGLWVDRQLGTEPFLLIVGMVLGFCIALWQLIRLGEASCKDHPSSKKDNSSKEDKAK